MGRSKLKMEMIAKEKSRSLTFHKRKQGLFKKLHELTTLCGIQACMIIHDPSNASSTSIWPENSADEIRRLVDAYRSQNKVAGSVKSYGLPDFFNDRRKEIDGELTRLRKKNSEAMYPTWGDRFSAMDDFQLRNLGAQLRAKAQNVRARINFLREKSEPFTNFIPRFYNPIDVMQQNSFFAAAAQIPANYYDLPPPPLPAALPPQFQFQYYPLTMDEQRNYDGCCSMDQNLNYWVGDDFCPT